MREKLIWIGPAILALAVGGGLGWYWFLRPLSPAAAPSIVRSTGAPETTAPAAPPQITFDAARAQVEATVASSPGNYRLRVDAAEFYMRAGENELAIPHLQAASRIEPQQLLPWVALGDAATLSGKFELAERSYDRADRVSPGYPLAIRGRAQLLIRQEKFQDARTLLEAGLRKHPSDPELRTALGNLLLVLNRPSEAAAVIKPALEKHPQRADLHYLLGDAYERDLHLEAAIREMREAVRLDPMMDEAWGRIGLYLVNLGRYADAREPLNTAIRLNPRQSHYHWALADSYLLDTTDPANFDRAIDGYKKALELDPKNDKALYSYGMALTRQGAHEDLPEAVRLFKRLLEINPQDTNVHFKLAETYRRMGQPEKAKPHQAKFDELFRLGRRQNQELYRSAAFKDTPEVHLRLGMRHLERKEYELAAKEFQFALERNPKLEAAQNGLREASRRLTERRGSAP